MIKIRLLLCTHRWIATIAILVGVTVVPLVRYVMIEPSTVRLRQSGVQLFTVPHCGAAGQLAQTPIGRCFVAAYCGNVSGINMCGQSVLLDDIRRVVCWSRVEQLIFDHTDITDAQLFSLGEMPCVRDIGLSGTDISDAGAHHLCSMKALREIALDDTRIGDETVASLSRLPDLRVLTICGTSVTDAGFLAVASCPTLEYIAIRGTSISRSAVATVRRLRPGLRVSD